jgi:hypothetical protein
MSSNRPLVATGLAFGLDTLEGLQFDILKDYTCCLLCGEVYQSDYDRHPSLKLSTWLPSTDDVARFALLMRKEWSRKHALTEHTEKEHADLAASGRFCTPDAALKLAAFGIISVTDLALDDEVQDALRQSSPIPKDDARDR